MLMPIWTLLLALGCAPPPVGVDAAVAEPSIEILFPESDPDITYCPVFTVVVDVDNLEYSTEDRLGGDHVEGQGHWHLYVNGEYIAYELKDWSTTPALEEGLNQLSVDLAQNDHQPYEVNGDVPTYIAEITVGDVEGCVGGGSPAAMDTGY